MDEIDLITNHVKKMPELVPEKPPKPPKKPPKEPKEPTAPEGKKVTPGRLKNWQERHDVWQGKWNEYEKALARHHEELELWRQKKVRSEILSSQVQMTKDGQLIGGSQHRVARLSGCENELEEEYYIGGDGVGYPDFGKILGGISTTCDPLLTITGKDIQGFRKFLEVVASEEKERKVTISEDQITFSPTKNVYEPLVSATWTLDERVKEPVCFGINTRYLVDMFKLMEKLKIKKVELYFVSPVRPMIFKADRLEYLVVPIRIA